MTQIRTFPRPELEARYVEAGRTLFADKFPGQDFDALSWNLEHLRKRSHKKTNANIYWTFYGSLSDPLPAPFAEVMKAVCVLDLQSPTNLIFRSDTARILWNALAERMSPSDFQWVKVGVDDLLRAEQLMRNVKAASSTYKSFSSFSRVLELLAAQRIIRPMSVQWTTPRPEDSERYTIEGREARRQMYMPSDEAIAAAADIFHRHAVTPSDRLLACAVALLLATGLRVGELLALPRSPLIRIGGEWRLRYWVEKNKRYDVVTLSLTPVQVELIDAAVEEVREITSEASHRAKQTEQDARIRLPGGLAPDDDMTSTELAEAMRLANAGSATSISKKKLPRRTVNGRATFRVADVAAYLTEQQSELWTIRGRQSLSQSLFVVFRNFLHAFRATIPLLVDGVNEQQINDFLGGRYEKCDPATEGSVLRNGSSMRPIVESAFNRFGLTEADGRSIEMTTHQFRHYVTTRIKEEGGADDLVARWQNRAYNADLSAYNHVKEEHRLTLLRNGITSGRIVGEVAEMYFTLADDLRDAYLETVVQHVHATDVGFCVHDFTAEPCPFHLNCLRGCKDYLADPQDEARRARLQELADRTRTVLEAEQRQAAETLTQISESWVSSHRQLLANIERILANPASGGCRFSRPFADGESRFVQLEGTR